MQHTGQCLGTRSTRSTARSTAHGQGTGSCRGAMNKNRRSTCPCHHGPMPRSNETRCSGWKPGGSLQVVCRSSPRHEGQSPVSPYTRGSISRGPELNQKAWCLLAHAESSLTGARAKAEILVPSHTHGRVSLTASPKSRQVTRRS
jgi:hypothetical protein